MKLNTTEMRVNTKYLRDVKPTKYKTVSFDETNKIILL